MNSIRALLRLLRAKKVRLAIWEKARGRWMVGHPYLDLGRIKKTRVSWTMTSASLARAYILDTNAIVYYLQTMIPTPMEAPFCAALFAENSYYLLRLGDRGLARAVPLFGELSLVPGIVVSKIVSATHSSTDHTLLLAHSPNSRALAPKTPPKVQAADKHHRRHRDASNPAADVTN